MLYRRDARNPNRDRLFERAGFDPSRVLGLELAHSRKVLFPSSADQHRDLEKEAAGRGGADGVILRDSRLAACVTVADCMPIWLHDRRSGAFGVLHSGWKGTGILAEAARELAARFGTGPEDISLILGPAIGPCCYDVPADRAESFAAEFGGGSAFMREGSWRIDMRAANLSIARALGIENILSIEACSSCDSRLGSYRRQGPGAFVRMAAACGFFAGPDSVPGPAEPS
jgi:YfiH family protein